MNDSYRPPSIKRVLIVVGLRTVPVMLISAFFVSLAADYLNGVHPLAFVFVLMFAMIGALWITTGSLLKELNEYANWRRFQREKRKKI